MGVKNKVIAGAVALAIGVGGYSGIKNENLDLAKQYQEGRKQIVGTVLAESYQNTLSPNPKFDGLVSYSNETVKLDSKYTLKIKTDDGRILGVSVIDAGGIKKESLDALIDEGSRVSFAKGNIRHDNNWSTGLRTWPGETYFGPNSQTGTKGADEFKVLDQTKE